MIDMWKAFGFKNTEYKAEWQEFVPFSGERYDEGSATVKHTGVTDVYDGAKNYMGQILVDGTLVQNAPEGAPADEYMMSFLRCAKKAKEELK